MTSTAQHFAAATDLARKPAERIASIIDLQADLERMITSNVAQMRDRGASWAEVSEATGISRQGAQQRWGRA